MVIELLAGTMRRGRGRIAAVEDDMRQTYTVKHIRKPPPQGSPMEVGGDSIEDVLTDYPSVSSEDLSYSVFVLRDFSYRVR